jgi:two-component system response regulator DesR
MGSKSISNFARDRESKAFTGPECDPPIRAGEHDVLLVDDRPEARWRVWALLRWERDIREIATADSGVEGLAVAQRCRPRVCLISATLGEREALTLAGTMKHLAQPPSVLILADVVDTDLAGAAIIAGADGVLWHYADPDELAAVIGRAADGDQHFPTLRRAGVVRLLDRVEDRDRAIVAMLLERVPPDEVARTLGISARALDLRRKSILKTVLGHPRERRRLRGRSEPFESSQVRPHSNPAPLPPGRRALAGSALGTPGSDGG